MVQEMHHRGRFVPDRFWVGITAWHVTTRLAVLGTMWLAGARLHRPFRQVVTRWDGTYYQQIAEHGYPTTLPVDAAGHAARSEVAFFPLFPALARAGMALGAPFWLAALVVNLLCSTATVWLIVAITARFRSPREAWLTGALWSVYPLSGALSAAYSESLLSVCAAGSLLALLQRRWVLAGSFALLAGATRPTGLVLALCCLWAAATAIRTHRDWRSLICVAMAPLGFAAALAYLSIRTHSAFAWFDTERFGWNARFDGGRDTVQTVARELTGHSARHFALEEGVAILAVLVLTVLALVVRQPGILRVYSAGVGVLAAGTTTVQASIVRFVQPAFPVLLPVAAVLAARRAWVCAVVLPALLVVSCALTYFYWGSGHYAP